MIDVALLQQCLPAITIVAAVDPIVQSTSGEPVRSHPQESTSPALRPCCRGGRSGHPGPNFLPSSAVRAAVASRGAADGNLVRGTAPQILLQSDLVEPHQYRAQLRSDSTRSRNHRTRPTLVKIHNTRPRRRMPVPITGIRMSLARCERQVRSQ